MHFPVGNVPRVLDPFHPLQASEFADDFLAQSCREERVGVEREQGLVQRLRQNLDAASGEFVRRGRVVVEVLRLAGFQPQLAYRAAEWTQRNRNAFLAGYTNAGGSDLRQHQIPLRAFEADKAVYEAVYEARNRPAWLAIPLASLARLAKTEDQS